MTSSSPSILFFEKPSSLTSLAESLLVITPQVYEVGPDIYADFSSTLHLWRSIDSVLEKVESILEELKLHCAWVLTQHLPWAKALCIHQKNIFIGDKDNELLFSLPVEFLLKVGNPLTLETQLQKRKELVSFLRKTGFLFISDLLKLPLTSLTSRFGSLALEIIDSLKGTLSFSLPAFTPQETLSFSIPLEQIDSAESLMYGLETFFPEIQARLEGRQAFIHTLDLSFTLENHTSFSKLICLDNLTRDLSAATPILRNHFDSLSLSAPVSEFTLTISETVSKPSAQLNLLDQTENQAEDLELFINRMKIQLGENQVGFPQLLFHYAPEKSWALTYPFQPAKFDYPHHKRPLFLFNQPRPFHPQHYQLEELEKIHGFWWETPIHRQYFLAQRPHQERLWVFFDLLTQNWFCHGSFD